MTHGHKADVHKHNVIDQSTTLCKGAGCTIVSAQTVIDWSMTVCKSAGCTMVSVQTVIDWSMTLSTLAFADANLQLEVV